MPSAALAQDQGGQVTVESAPDDPAADDAIVVTAIQRSLATSQAIKQDSDQIVDSIVAEDIGKLPDVTATESLARITGVQVDYRSEEHTSELQSLMRISYAVLCLKKKK